MSRTRVVLTLVLALLAVPACTSESPEPPAVTPTASARPTTPTPETSPTPSAPSPAPTPDEQDVTVPPERPAALDGPGTEDNAKEVGRYVMALVPYAIATGDLSAWDALSGETCTYCANVRAYVVENHGAGHRSTGGALELGFTSGIALGDGEFVVGVTYDEEASRTVTADGRVVDESPAATYKANVSLLWSGSAWKVQGVRVDPWDEAS